MDRPSPADVVATARNILDQRRDEKLVTLEWFARSEEITPGLISELARLGKEFGFRLRIRVLRNGWRYLILRRLPT